MRLLSLSLENFRSHGRRSLAFDEGDISIFLGPNGAGKTNVLEAISILSQATSCLSVPERDLVRFGEEYYRIRACVRSDVGDELSLEVASVLSPRQQKAYFVNDVKRKMLQFIGTFPTVAFLPHDLELFSGSPDRRRRFLDDLLTQIAPEFLSVRTSYERTLKQRNACLRRIAEGVAGEGDLDIWDQSIAEIGSVISRRRLELLETLQCTLPAELHALGEKFPDVRLVYLRKEEDLHRLLVQHRPRDLLLQTTTVGPHREDWLLEVSGRNFATFASRGQERCAVLALLFLEVSYVELRRSEQPVVLLDDVFSELDAMHQRAVLQTLENHQIIITATHVPEGIGDVRILPFSLQASIIFSPMSAP